MVHVQQTTIMLFIKREEKKNRASKIPNCVSYESCARADLHGKTKRARSFVRHASLRARGCACHLFSLGGRRSSWPIVNQSSLERVQRCPSTSPPRSRNVTGRHVRASIAL